MPLNKLDPSKLNSWKELKAQFDKEEFLTIDKLMEESDRLKNFSVEWEGLFLDFTKNRISQSTLNVLIKLYNKLFFSINIFKYSFPKQILITSSMVSLVVPAISETIATSLFDK